MSASSLALPSVSLSPELLPRHIGVIMDGNGRWARAHGVSRLEGHAQGMEAARQLVRACLELNIPILTIYGFSCENWARSQEEISTLMELMWRFLESDLKSLHERHVRVRILGEREGLDAELCEALEKAEALTLKNDRLQLVVAFNYGGRQEITGGVRRLAQKVAEGQLDPSTITSADITDYLYMPDLPDPDLIIRTSGEERLSNFLIWQAAYAEFVFLPCLWPDFDEGAFNEALTIYAKRQRRFGGRP